MDTSECYGRRPNDSMVIFFLVYIFPWKNGNHVEGKLGMSFALKSPDPLGSDILLVGSFPQRILRVDLYKWDFFLLFHGRRDGRIFGYTPVCGHIEETSLIYREIPIASGYIAVLYTVQDLCLAFCGP